MPMSSAELMKVWGSGISRIFHWTVDWQTDAAKQYLPYRECRLRRSRRQDTSSGNSEDQPSQRTGPQIYTEQMISNGWCPHQVQHLSKTYNYKTFSYLATLERSSQRLVDHKRCLEHSACIAYNTSTVNYKVRHTTDDCICSMIVTPYRDLVQIIRRGRIPLVSIDLVTGATPPYQLRVHSRSATSKYIAISHVWADGLGNPGLNGLPLCQIERLNARLSALQRLMKGDKVSRPFILASSFLCVEFLTSA